MEAVVVVLDFFWRLLFPRLEPQVEDLLVKAEADEATRSFTSIWACTGLWVKLTASTHLGIVGR